MTAPNTLPDRPQYYDAGVQGQIPGIAFQLPTHRRFIPYSWLLYSEMNEEQTRIRIYYTHCLVTITGKSLEWMHGRLERFELSSVREGMPSVILNSNPAIFRIEISEMER